ncbi:MAG: MFS transporter [Firmicutes bacterium]|nr:MFS transporter [Bacillota bacterium]
MDRLSRGTILKYGSAGLGDAVAYSIVCTYLLFFLTTVADIRPAAAGTMIAIGSVSDSVLNAVMGYVSDNVDTRWGRRVPFMFIGGILLFFSMLLLFTAIDAASIIKAVYYVFFVILFYISYTGFFVPYLALGAEFTQDYDERTRLRSYTALFNMIGSMAAMVLPASMVGFLTGKGFSEAVGWMITAGSLGLISSVSVLITCKEARKFDKPATDKVISASGISLKNMFGQYLQVLKLSPVRYLLFASLFFLISYGMLISDIMYFFTYNMGFSSGRISWLLLCRCIVGIVIIPFIDKACNLTDKRYALMVLQALFAILIALSGLLGITSIFRLYVYIFFMGAATVIYWQIMPAIIYDVCEYDQLMTGQKRQGTIVSIQGFVESISAGLGTQILGIILQLAGFDGNVQTQPDLALTWIERCLTYIPAAFLLLSSAALLKYPITKKVYEEIRRKLDES